jgi:excisionase family DNA binding protein
MSALKLDLPDEIVQEIACRAAAIVASERTESAPAWLGVEQAAEYLACPRSRLYRLVHLDRIPHEHEGARLLFNREDLDAWIRAGGAS